MANSVMKILLISLALAVTSAQKIILESSIEKGRTYACPDEVVNYRCTGNDTTLIFFLPPIISLSNRVVFFDTSPLGAGTVSEFVTTNLIRTNSPPLRADFTLRDPGMSNLTLTCGSGSDSVTFDSKTVTYLRSDDIIPPGNKPTIVGMQNGVVMIMWDIVRGEFDIASQLVNVSSADGKFYAQQEVAPGTSNITLFVGQSVTITANLQYSTLCGQPSNLSTVSDPFLVNITSDPPSIVIIVCYVILSVIIVILAVVLIMFCISCKKK